MYGGLDSFVLLASGLVVKQDASLRAGCETSDELVAQAPAGSPAEIRFAMSGSTAACYKVHVKIAGKGIDGYLPASALEGIEEFTRGVQQAAPVTRPSPRVAEPVNLPRIQSSPDSPLVQASKLLEQRQPRAALEIIEKSMKASGRDYPTLLLAGISAYQADDTRVALDYLRDSQRLKEDLSVQRLIEKLEREQAGDKSGERLYGNRFLLRYEGGNLNPEIAREMVGLLEQEFSHIAAQLGCRADERIARTKES